VTVTGECPQCRHEWADHPVAILAVSVCVECSCEEDHGLRDDVCEAVPPELATKTAATFLTASASRSPLGLSRVYLFSKSGTRQHWGTQYLGWTSSRRAAAVANDMNEAMSRLTVKAFRSSLTHRSKAGDDHSQR